MSVLPAAFGRQQTTPAKPVSPDGPPVPVAMDPPTIELGYMMPETKKSGQVEIVNLSSAPLHIVSVRPTCSCTVPELKAQYIEPGASVPLKATFESPQFMGPVRRNVYVFFEGYPQPVKIDINCWVDYGVKALVRYDDDKKRHGAFTLEDNEGRPFKVIAANRKPPVFLDGFDPAKDQPRSKYVVEVDLRSIPEAEVPKWFLVELDHPTAAVVDMRVAKDEPEQPKPGMWKMSHDRVLLYNIKPGDSKEVGILLKDLKRGAPVEVEKTEVKDGLVAVSFERMETTVDGPKMIFKVTPREGLSGLIFDTVNVTIQGQTQSFDVIGRAVAG
ncbi:MAG TPA: DUF1573 domain-containing protein [Phycisphaerales bacterium]|nr:DUF1573 domain-containing protein [Phycisphaerales bacterium]